MKKKVEKLDYHEGLTGNQVKIILRAFGLPEKEFNEWMNGQTCPVLLRRDETGIQTRVLGIYEYDLFRYVEWKKKGVTPIWD